MRRLEPPAGFEAAEPSSIRIEDAELQEALAVANEACDRARAEILPRFRNVSVDRKSDGSPVTEADLAAERAIRATIEKAFPDDSILGEEFGASERSSRRRWIIDPIDGTIAFSRGIPLFTTLVALTIDEEPVLGVIDLPAADDRIAGRRGGGVWRGSERVFVRDAPGTRTSAAPPASATDALEQALICHGDLFCFDQAGLRPLYDALANRVRTLRGYTDAFGHLLVLSGAADAMVDCDLNPWDAAVTRVLTHEAGGTCWVRERAGGAKLDLLFGSPQIVREIGALLA